MKLFTVGPVEMYRETLDLSGKQLPYFRTSEFSEMMLESEMMLKRFVNAQNSSKVIFLTASGTGAMEATVMNCFTEFDRLLIISGGGFGERFEKICNIHKIPFDTVKIPFGERLTEDMLSEYDGKGYAGLLVNLDETSTGQLYDKNIISAFCKRNGTLFVADAISSFLADELDMCKWNIDVVIISSQKALALSPGLSIVIVSDRMFNDRISNVDSGSLYFDFKEHIENQKRGQTPFTPAVGVLIELHEMLKSLESKGIDVKIAETKAQCEHFRTVAKESGLIIPSYPLSNAVTPIMFPEGNAIEVFETLRCDYDITVTPSGGALKKIMLRVGHMGNLTRDDNDQLISALKEIVR